MNHWHQRSSVDRMPERRTERDLDELWTRARMLEVDVDGGVLVGPDGQPVTAAPRGARREDDVLVGAWAGSPWFVRAVAPMERSLTRTWRELDEAWQQIAAVAVALVRWHAAAPPCEGCGGNTVPDAGGARRRCRACGALAFPRQDPAIIVAVLDVRDRLLLARQASWAPGRFSLLAGFVEPGESLEQAVWREVEEEVGISLTSVQYVSSQPWPLPRSLMFGFSARTAEERLSPDGHEIEQARYVEREELLRDMAGGQLSLPSSASIARHLIESWLAGTLPVPPAIS